ncbi:MAG: hypothetical protein HUJ94_02370 [Bacteroidales bacterium]|nr:hypothetical protein [Bacteroidales bacterium]
MKRTSYISAVAALLALAGCEKQDWTYQGPQYCEFSPSMYGQGVSNGMYFKENTVVGMDTVAVQLIAHNEADVTVKFSIVDSVYYRKDISKYVASIPAGLDKSLYRVERSEDLPIYGTDYEIPAKEGVSFDAASRKGSLTIAKGEYFGKILVDMKVKAGASFFVVLEDSDNCLANVPSSIIRYDLSPDKIFYFEESFLEEIPDTWTILDKDGDGYSWEWYKKAATSDSYRSKTALTPENYLVSPAVTIGSKMRKVILQFDHAAGDDEYFEEQYRIVVSTSPITLDNCRNAKVVRDWTKLDTYEQTTEMVDISEYRGQKIYFAFVHGNCTDNYYIKISNIFVYGL